MNTRIYFFVIKFILVLNFSFSSTYLINFQETDSLYYTNPDYHVAKELFNKRIVMLGDYGHHQPGPFHHLYGVLKNWFQICSFKNGNIKLTLIIENPASTTDLINEFIKNGNLSTITDSALADNYTLEDFEYFNELRNFSLKVDSMNQIRSNKISFCIKSFENEGKRNPQYLIARERDLWFVNERDLNTSKGIIDYMMNNPEEQVLMYYGTAHLCEGYVDKYLGLGQFGNELSDSERKGYWLVHYLKDEFGKDKVVTFFTLDYYPELIKNLYLVSVIYKEFITRTKNIELPWKMDVDYVMVCHTPQFVPNTLNISHICSNYVLEKHVEEFERDSEFYGSNDLSFISAYIYLLSGKKIRDEKDFTDFMSSKDFKCVDWLFSDNFYKAIVKQLTSFKSNNDIFYLLSSYEIPWKYNTPMYYAYNFENMIERIRFTNSIGIYWFGYPDEKIKAKEYLVKFSGEDYAEPEKYLQWYRKTYFGYDY